MQQKSFSSINLFGFAILRNGVKYDYSFIESLISLKPIVENVYLALDAGEDSTKSEIEKLNFVKIIPSVWDLNLKKGLVLSVETNKALDSLRNEHQKENDWGIYLQADEVIHEDDYELLRKDIEKANEQGFDAISFRYLHFWQTHHHIAVSKKWYPHEIRCIKLNSKIESWGDAQGFRNYKKVYHTEARIFHYGHVREQESYKNKMNDMGKMYHSDESLEMNLAKGRKDAKKNKCVLFFGNHPLVMKERILRMNDIWSLPESEEVYIVGNPSDYTEQLKQKINSKKIIWANKLSEIDREKRKFAIITKPNWLDYTLKRTSVPNKMKSKHALIWSLDFQLILFLSEKKVGLKN
jgi:hypothetical protein